MKRCIWRGQYLLPRCMSDWLTVGRRRGRECCVALCRCQAHLGRDQREALLLLLYYIYLSSFSIFPGIFSPPPTLFLSWRVSVLRHGRLDAKERKPSAAANLWPRRVSARKLLITQWQLLWRGCLRLQGDDETASSSIVSQLSSLPFAPLTTRPLTPLFARFLLLQAQELCWKTLGIGSCARFSLNAVDPTTPTQIVATPLAKYATASFFYIMVIIISPPQFYRITFQKGWGGRGYLK